MTTPRAFFLQRPPPVTLVLPLVMLVLVLLALVLYCCRPAIAHSRASEKPSIEIRP